MRLLGLAAAMLLAVVLYSPASAQSVYIGPGGVGVGVDVGPRPPPRGQGYYDDGPRGYRGDGYYRPPPRCRWVYVQRGPYTERVRECY